MQSPTSGSFSVCRPISGRQRAVLALILTGVLLFPGLVSGMDCGSCGAKGVSALAMYCPNCRTSLHTPQTQRALRTTAMLAIDISYTGDRPDRLPEYGKIYINGIYKGNIPISEREARQQSFDVSSSHGLGYDYTARYHADLRELDAGLFRIEVEMKFRRLFGLARSIRRVCFPYVALRSGEKTVLKHTFSRGSSFQKRGTASATTVIPVLPGLPAIPEMNNLLQLTPGTGTLGIEVPFFE